MQPYKETIALSFSDHKQTALFFDKLWPMHSMDLVPEQLHDITVNIPLFYEGAEDLVKNMGSLIMTVSKSPFNSVTFKGPDFSLLHFLMSQFYKKKAKAFGGRGDSMFLFLEVIVGSLIYELLILDGYNVVPVFGDPKLQEEFYSTGDWIFLDQQAVKKEKSQALQINVNNLKLVATDRAEWGQITEFRKDVNSVNKLRNLRILFQDSYKDKDVGYIKDDIDRRIEEYEYAAKKHGFDLRNAVVKSFLDPASVAGLTALTVGGIIMSPTAPIALPLSGLIGATFQTAKVLVEFKQQQFEFKRKKETDQIAYVVETRDKLLTPKKPKRWYQFWRRRS